MIVSHKTAVAVVGLGYVGLPLCIEFGKKRRTIGFDLSDEKIQNCRSHIDPMGEVSPEQFEASKFSEFTNHSSSLSEADVVIICVPTPIDIAKIQTFALLKMPLNSLVKISKKTQSLFSNQQCIPVLPRILVSQY